MNTPANLMRKNYPEFLKELEKFKDTFGSIKREYVKCGPNEFGKKFKGVSVNPVISDKITMEQKK